MIIFPYSIPEQSSRKARGQSGDRWSYGLLQEDMHQWGCQSPTDENGPGIGVPATRPQQTCFLFLEAAI